MESVFQFYPRWPSVIAALTCTIYHQNVIHLLGNMVFLAAVGPLVEFAVGRWQFLTIYVGGGLAGVAGHWILTSGMAADQPLVGASGSIAACVGYCAVRFMSAKVPIAPHIGLPVGALAVVWIGLQALGGFVRIGESDAGTTAFWAHLAGFLAGLLLSLVFRAPSEANRKLGHEVLDKMNDRSPAAALAAAEHHLRRHPGDRRALRMKAEALHLLHDQEGEQSVYLELLDSATDLDQVELLRKLEACGGLIRLSVGARQRLADQHGAQFPDIADALLTSILDDPDAGAQVPDTLLSLATLVKDSQPAKSSELLERLTTQYALHPATELARSRGLIP